MSRETFDKTVDGVSWSFFQRPSRSPFKFSGRCLTLWLYLGRLKVAVSSFVCLDQAMMLDKLYGNLALR